MRGRSCAPEKVVSFGLSSFQAEMCPFLSRREYLSPPPFQAFLNEFLLQYRMRLLRGAIIKLQFVCVCPRCRCTAGLESMRGTLGINSRPKR